MKLTGGEPTLLHPHFAGIVAHLHELDISFSLFTNGCWPDPDGVIDLLRNTPTFRGFLISLHGATPQAHEAFTGMPGSFDRAVKAIRCAVVAGFSVTASTVLHRHNLDELREVAVLACSLGAHRVAFNRYLGPPLLDIEPSEEELLNAVEAIEALRPRPILDDQISVISSQLPVKFGNCIPQCFTPSSASGCLAGVAYCTVDPWGNVRPCNHSPTLCGNLLEQPIEEIWHSEAMEAWRSRIPVACHACAAFPRCHGGCRALAEVLNLPTDPLMRGPLKSFGESEVVSLYEGLRPLCVGQWREEPFGYVLMRGNHIIPIRRDERTLVEACDGQATLRELADRFGQPSLRLIYALYQQGVLALR